MQGNLNNLDSTLSLVAITQILDFDNPSTCVPLRDVAQHELTHRQLLCGRKLLLCL